MLFLDKKWSGKNFGQFFVEWMAMSNGWHGWILIQIWWILIHFNPWFGRFVHLSSCPFFYLAKKAPTAKLMGPTTKKDIVDASG
jgi:hypothetical protein